MTTEDQKYLFWDIESYSNFFCLGLLQGDTLEFFYLSDSTFTTSEINRALDDISQTYTVKRYDLSQDVGTLVEHFRIYETRSVETTIIDEITGIKNAARGQKEGWYFGYNTIAYDLPMIDYVLKSVVDGKVQTTPETLRLYSDQLINDKVYVNVNDYLVGANQVDCAFLNEKMLDKGRPTIGLKTLVGVRGGSIVESDSNKSGFSDDVYGDVYYNLNDIVELRDIVFPGTMSTTFKIRSSLMDRYSSLRQHGITPNDSSAKFVEYIVAPDKPIEDNPVMTFMYPAEHIAKELGVEQRDLLEDTKDWYMEKVYARVKKHNPTAAKQHLAKFMSVYSFYASLRNKNWNSTARHVMKYDIPAEPNEMRGEIMSKYGLYVPFIDETGKETTTYANFSVGGVHGAEFYGEQLEKDRETIRYIKQKYKTVDKVPTGLVPKQLMNLIEDQSRETIRGYPQRFSHEIPEFYRRTKRVNEIVDPDQFTPYTYDAKSGREKLHTRYRFTSIADMIHQDFEGYYPMLLINLGAFFDGVGEDPYAKIYQHRVSVKKKLKKLVYGTIEYELVDIEQGGYKLVLNSASGVLDAQHDNNLRANNKAMAMRCIGQLMTFRIGLTLSLEGASVPSTNTDGLYVSKINYDLNKRLVDEELKNLYVHIEPEPLYLVSKDTNTRLEMVKGRVKDAKGATLNAWQGGRVDSRLSRPAFIDRALVEYLQIESNLDGPPDRERGRLAIQRAREGLGVFPEFKDYVDGELRTLVYMTSWVLRSTSGSIFVDNRNTVYTGTIRTWLTDNGMSLKRYTVNKAKPSRTLDRYASAMMPQMLMGDPDVIAHLAEVDAIKYLSKAITVSDYLDREDKKESIPIVKETKISNLPDNAYLYQQNDSLYNLSEQEVQDIAEHLDWDLYLDMLLSSAKTWHNQLAPWASKKLEEQMENVA